MSGSEENNGSKRKSFTINEKMNILAELDRGGSIAQVSLKYGVPQRTLRGWREKRKILEDYREHHCLQDHQKRIKVSPNDDMDEALYLWFSRSIENGIPVSGPMVQMKALELHDEMKIPTQFTASSGWLTHWKKRYNIKGSNICGERKSADSLSPENAVTFREKLDEEIVAAGYELSQLFNADETRLDFKSMPKRYSEEKSQKKDRVTVMTCSNADGSFRLPLVVIGKLAKPSAIRDIPKSSLPVYYRSQKSAWMSPEIFEEWFKSEFVPKAKEFLKEKKLPQKALLLLDNAPHHPSADRLEVGDFKVRYLPANTSSTIIKPKDHGIVENMKRRYKALFLNSVLYAQKDNISLSAYLESVNIKNVIEWISQAWNDIPESTLFECWKDLLAPRYYSDESTENSNQSEISNESLLQQVRRVHDFNCTIEEFVQDWVNDSGENPTPSNEELIQMVTADEDQIEQEAITAKTTADDCVFASDVIINYCQQTHNFPAWKLQVLLQIKQDAMKASVSD